MRLEVIRIVGVAKYESSFHVVPEAVLKNVVVDLVLLLVVNWDDCELQVVSVTAAGRITMPDALHHPQSCDILQVLVGIDLTFFIAPLVDLLERKSFICVFLQLSLRQHSDVAESWRIEIYKSNVGRFQNGVFAKRRKFSFT